MAQKLFVIPTVDEDLAANKQLAHNSWRPSKGKKIKLKLHIVSQDFKILD